MKKTLLFIFLFLLSGCQMRSKIDQTRTISRHYTLQQGHASLSKDDYGETKYITSKDSDNVVYTNHTNFDSFNYYENISSKEPIHNNGFQDYININPDLTYFDFHYSGQCNYRIEMKDGYVYQDNGTYLITQDDINVSFSSGKRITAIMRFGLNHDGLGKDRIVFLQTLFILDISGEKKSIYLWFYDGILHNSPWGEE